MKNVKVAILLILIAMSLAAGVAKVMMASQEVRLFADAGLSASWILPIGVLQVLGSLATVFGKTRQAGLIAIALGFLISAIVIFLTGNTVFGLVSLVPVLLILFASWSLRSPQ